MPAAQQTLCPEPYVLSRRGEAEMSLQRFVWYFAIVSNVAAVLNLVRLAITRAQAVGAIWEMSAPFIVIGGVGIFALNA